MAGPHPVAISLSPAQQTVLEALLRQHSCPQALALRARIVLGAASGTRNEPLARQLGCTAKTVWKWRNRWGAAASRLAAAEADPRTLPDTIADLLADAPRSGTPGTFTAEQIVQIVNLACTPPRTAGHPIDAWTPRELAEAAVHAGIVTSISPTTVGRFLKRGPTPAASQPLLAQCQDQSG